MNFNKNKPKWTGNKKIKYGFPPILGLKKPMFSLVFVSIWFLMCWRVDCSRTSKKPEIWKRGLCDIKSSDPMNSQNIFFVNSRMPFFKKEVEGRSWKEVFLRKFRLSGFPCPLSPPGPGLAWAWLCLAWLCLAWPALAWSGLAGFQSFDFSEFCILNHFW